MMDRLAENVRATKPAPRDSRMADGSVERGLRVLARLMARDLMCRDRAEPDGHDAKADRTMLPDDHEDVS